MKIAVLAGGNSTEREISIVSGTEVCRALRKKGHLAVLVDVCTGAGADGFPKEYDPDAAAAKIRALDDAVARNREEGGAFFGDGVLSLCREADFVFLALHGANGEDGRIQAVMELMGIPYTGSGPLGSAIAMDKDLTKQILTHGGVPTPPWVRITKEEWEENGKHARDGWFPYGLPAVVKVNNGGSSVGVYIVHNEAECEEALRQAFALEDVVLTEKYIPGREFSVGIIEGRALPVIEIAPKEGFYDYKNKYTAGATVETCPADLPEEESALMQRYAEQGFRLLRLCGYGRLDFIKTEEGEVFILEANTLPGMTPISLLPQEAAAEGMAFPELCETLIRASAGARGTDLTRQ